MVMRGVAAATIESKSSYKRQNLKTVAAVLGQWCWGSGVGRMLVASIRARDMLQKKLTRQLLQFIQNKDKAAQRALDPVSCHVYLIQALLH